MMRGNEAPMQVDSPRPPSALAGPATGAGTTSSTTAPGTPFSFGRSTVSGPSTPAATTGFTFAPEFSTPLRTPVGIKASRRSHYSDPPSPGLPRTPSDDDRDEHERDEHGTEPAKLAAPTPSFLGKARQSLSAASESAKKLSAAVFTSTPARATPAAVPATPASTSGAADVFRTPSMTPSRAAAARSRLSTTVTPRRTGPLRPRATPGGTAPRPSKRARQASESGDEDEDEDGDARSTTSYAMTPHAMTPYHHAMASPMYSTPYAPPQMFPMTFTPVHYATAQPTDDESDVDDDAVEPAPSPALPPHLALLGYLHVLWNVLLASAGAYVVYTAYAAAAADLAHRFQAYTADEAAKIDECARQYVTNRCDPATRVPAVNAFCLDLEKCMQADPTRVPATALSAAAVAELIDAFVAKLSYKSLGFLLAIAAVTAMMNWACSCARPRAAASAIAPAVSKPVRRARPQRTPMHHPHHTHHHHPIYSPFANPYAGAYGSPMAYMSPAGPQHVPPTPGTVGSVVKRRMGAVVEEE
ncbi:hypothetical protein GGF31_003858 [Allomyces arbusculus]|nr:hypothetical protein GGF31_003858 [Allomyces arbusculus]